jgi:nicotinamide-nucleotide amidase
MLPERAEALAKEVGRALSARGLMIATAESCTGGLLAGALTAIPGSSEYVKGGVVAYSNEVKQSHLGVQAATLDVHGAVSEPTAREMAEGVRERMEVGVGVGITGVAGPGGGTAEKPVGLVYIGVATAHHTEVRRDVWPGSRADIRAASVLAALELVLAMVIQS